MKQFDYNNYLNNNILLAESIEDWINDWSNKKNSAVDLWGNASIWNKIKKAGKNVKIARSEKALEVAKKEGWKLIGREDNSDSKEKSFEAILIK